MHSSILPRKYRDTVLYYTAEICRDRMYCRDTYALPRYACTAEINTFKCE